MRICSNCDKEIPEDYDGNECPYCNSWIGQKDNL